MKTYEYTHPEWVGNDQDGYYHVDECRLSYLSTLNPCIREQIAMHGNATLRQWAQASSRDAQELIPA